MGIKLAKTGGYEKTHVASGVLAVPERCWTAKVTRLACAIGSDRILRRSAPCTPMRRQERGRRARTGVELGTEGMPDQQPRSADQQAVGDVEDRPINQTLDSEMQPVAHGVDGVTSPVGGKSRSHLSPGSPSRS